MVVGHIGEAAALLQNEKGLAVNDEAPQAALGPPLARRQRRRCLVETLDVCAHGSLPLSLSPHDRQPCPPTGTSLAKSPDPTPAPWGKSQLDLIAEAGRPGRAACGRA